MGKYIIDAGAIVGAGLIVTGVCFWSIPAALIVAGLGIFTACVLGAKRERPGKPH